MRRARVHLGPASPDKASLVLQEAHPVFEENTVEAPNLGPEVERGPLGPALSDGVRRDFVEDARVAGRRAASKLLRGVAQGAQGKLAQGARRHARGEQAG